MLLTKERYITNEPFLNFPSATQFIICVMGAVAEKNLLAKEEKIIPDGYSRVAIVTRQLVNEAIARGQITKLI